MRIFYVYAYFRLDGSPCYIGRGKGNRWLEHEQNRAKRNRRLVSLINAAGGTLPKCKLVENLTIEEASAIESTLIHLVGRGRRGPLVNMTDGGDGGTPGLVVTAATRAKISAAMTLRMADPEERRKVSERHKGKKGIGVGRPSHVWSKESRAKLSAKHKGKTLSPEHRAKISAGVRARLCK